MVFGTHFGNSLRTEFPTINEQVIVRREILAPQIFKGFEANFLQDAIMLQLIFIYFARRLHYSAQSGGTEEPQISEQLISFYD